MAQRVLVVGWDGADWEIVDDLLGRGLLPNLQAMLEEGGRGTLRSSIPSQSWSAWTSFLTGYHPATHGVWDFVERDPTDPDRRLPVSSTSIRQPTFLDRLSVAGIEVRAANIPVTFPPWDLNGRMIGGVAVPKGSRFVTPREWAAELERVAPFPLNGMEWMRYEDRPEALVGEGRSLVEERLASFEALLEGSWQVAVCVFVEPDRLQHPLGAYLLPSHPRYGALADSAIADGLRGAYASVDTALGQLRRAAGPDALTIVLSDHGFRPIAHLVGLNRLLQTLGFASAGSHGEMARSLRTWAPVRKVARSRLGHRLKRNIRAPSTLDWGKTAAYPAGTGGAVSINLKGREIHGTVEPADYERVRAEVAQALLDYRDPSTGTHPIAKVLLREDLPGGDRLDLAPDLMARPSPLWTLGNIGQVTSDATWPSGDHRQEGILIASHAMTPDLGAPSIVDIAPTLLATQGLTVPALDGTPIRGIVGEDLSLDEQGDDAAPAVRSTVGDLDDEEQDEIASHLRDLGYIE
ncbi:MAG TPA: alkaline phosphatase family protein [Actinomycetota bacterium]|nr:alkaline phosphatase family protein [Actinomycetota bacterium]